MITNNLFMILWISTMLGVGLRKDHDEFSTLAAHILVVAVAHFVFLKALFDNEVAERRTFIRDALLRCDHAFTKKENADLKLIIDDFKEKEGVMRSVDLDAPVEKMLTLLGELEAKTPGVSAEQKKQIRWMTTLLNSNANIYTPNLEAQVAAGKSGLDANTSDWLLSHTTGMSSAATVAEPRPALQGKNERPEAKVKGNAVAPLPAPQMPSSSFASPSGVRVDPLKPGASSLHVSSAQYQTLSMERAEGEHLPAADREFFSKSLTSWNFDIFKLERMIPEGHMAFVGLKVMRALDLLAPFSIDKQRLVQYLYAVERGYWAENAYHNASHGTDVVQACYYFLTTAGMARHFEPHDLFAVLMGAAVHDLDHPGVNNNFEIAIRSDKALIYNDRSPLENHHISRAFVLLRNDELNLFHKTSPKDLNEIRRVMIEVVLATDLKEHFAIVGQLKNMVKSRPYDKTNKDDRMLLLRSVIKCGDVNNPTKAQAQMDLWTDRFLEETYAQGDRERELKLPISAFMDRYSPNVPKLELGFIDFLVRPLFAVFDEFHQGHGVIHDTVCAQLEENYKLWKKREAEATEKAAATTLPGKSS